MSKDFDFFEDNNWVSGLLLKSQHFQSIKQYTYNNIFNLLKLTNNNFWGIINLKLDFNNVQEGKIKVNKLVCLNKDGSIINYNSELEDDICSSLIDLSLKDFDRSKDEFTIYLATIKYNDSVNNNLERYYQTTHGPIKDLNGIDEDSFIHRHKVKPYFLSESELLSKHEYLPLFKVKKIKNSWSNIFFVPPCLVINSDNEYMQRIVKCIITLQNKVEIFMSKIIVSVKQQYFDYKTFINIRITDMIAILLSEIKPTLEKCNIYTFDFHNLLNKIVCVLCIANNERIQSFSYYNHSDLDKTFEPILLKIEQLSVCILNDDLIVQSFDVVDSSNREIDVNENMFINGKLYIQCMLNKSLVNDLNLVLQELSSLTIVSKDKLENVLSLRVSGIKREPILDSKNIRDITGIVAMENVIYISLNAINDKFFTMNNKLCIFGQDVVIKKYNFSIVYTNKNK